MNKSWKKKYYRYLVLASCCGIICTSVGIVVNSIGIFYGPLAETLGTGRGNIAIFGTILNLVTALAGPLIVILQRKRSLRVILLIGSITLSAGLGMLTFTNSLIYLYFLAPLIGFGAALLGTVPVFSVLNNWFNDKYGLATGIVMACGGCGGVFVPPVFSNIIRICGWRCSFMILAVVILLLSLPGILLIIRDAPQQMETTVSPSAQTEHKTRSDYLQNIRPRHSFSMTVIYICIIAFTTASIHGLTSFLAEYGYEMGMSITMGALLISICMAGNICSKLLCGIMLDYIGAKKTTIFLCLITITGLLFLLNAKESGILMYIGAGLYGMSYAINSLCVSQLARECYGKEKFSEVYAIASPFCYLGMAIYLPICGFLFDFTQSYKSSIFLAVILVLVAIAATAFICKTNHDRKP